MSVHACEIRIRITVDSPAAPPGFQRTVIVRENIPFKAVQAVAEKEGDPARLESLVERVCSQVQEHVRYDTDKLEREGFHRTLLASIRAYLVRQTQEAALYKEYLERVGREELERGSK